MTAPRAWAALLAAGVPLMLLGCGWEALFGDIETETEGTAPGGSKGGPISEGVGPAPRNGPAQLAQSDRRTDDPALSAEYHAHDLSEQSRHPVAGSGNARSTRRLRDLQADRA